MSKIKSCKVVLVIMALFVLACGGATPEVVTGGEDKQSEPAVEAKSEDAKPQGFEIVENAKVVVAIEAELAHKYEQMGIDEVLAQKLVISHLELNIPEGFKFQEAKPNNIWESDFSIVADSGKVEVRYRVVPQSEDPISTGTADEPITPGVAISRELMTTMISLNGGNLVADLQKHPDIQAQARFNADNYSTGTFTPTPEFSKFEVGSAGLFYKNGHARVFAISLLDGMNDPQTRTEWITGSSVLQFADSE